MTAVYSKGRRFSFESEADTEALIEAMKTDAELNETVSRFEPTGSWCVLDDKGVALIDSGGKYVTTSLSADGMARYCRAASAVDYESVRAREAERLQRVLQQSLPIASKGSTGEDWWDET
jgi:hypothetical protein